MHFFGEHFINNFPTCVHNGDVIFFQYMKPQQSMWSRSYHNPVGNVYHAPSEADDRWATWDRKLSPADNPDPKELPPRNYPLGYGLMNHMDTYGRRKPTIGLGAFLPRPMASQTPMGPPYVPMPGYSPYAGASPQGSQILLPEGSLRLKGFSFISRLELTEFTI